MKLPHRTVLLPAFAIGVVVAVTLSGCTGGGSASGGTSADSTGASPLPGSTGGSSGATSSPGSAGASGSSASGSSVPGTTTASGGGSTTSGPGSSSSGAGSARRPIDAVTIQGLHSTYPISIWVRQRTRRCATVATGAMKPALRRFHCSLVTRTLASTILDGREVGLSLATIRLDLPAKQRPHAVVSLDATAMAQRTRQGGIRSLLADGRRFPGAPGAVPSPNVFQSFEDPVGLTVVDGWYLGRRTADDDPDIATMLEEVYTSF